MEDTRFDLQIRFLREIDRLKQVFRQTWLLDGSRKENDAECARGRSVRDRGCPTVR